MFIIMKYKVFLFVVFVGAIFSGCHRQVRSAAEPVTITKKEAPVMPDFVLNDTEGNPFSALEYVKKNKLTIVDFWASWCGPCREEMPNVVALYENYKNKGLGILGVSLDNSREAWIAAIKSMEITWPQVSDLKGWHNAAAVQFGIQSIPYTMILDNEGHLLETNLRGDVLASFVSVRLH